MSDKYKKLLQPAKLYSRHEILSAPSPTPQLPGIYGWYFKNFPSTIPSANCITCGEATLLYIGIAPCRPSSRQKLYGRLRLHLKRNADVSTLRLSLGCLLAETLGIQLRRVGNGNRMTFAAGERKLSDWLEQNAFVVWVVKSEPWEVEKELIQKVSLPLNLEHNKTHPFHDTLSALRDREKSRAEQLPILQ